MLRRIEPSTLGHLCGTDPVAARAALAGLLEAYSDFQRSPLFNDSVELLEPMLVKVVIERYVLDPDTAIIEAGGGPGLVEGIGCSDCGPSCASRPSHIQATAPRSFGPPPVPVPRGVQRLGGEGGRTRVEVLGSSP